MYQERGKKKKKGFGVVNQGGGGGKSPGGETGSKPAGKEAKGKSGGKEKKAYSSQGGKKRKKRGKRSHFKAGERLSPTMNPKQSKIERKNFSGGRRKNRSLWVRKGLKSRMLPKKKRACQGRDRDRGGGISRNRTRVRQKQKPEKRNRKAQKGVEKVERAELRKEGKNVGGGGAESAKEDVVRRKREKNGKKHSLAGPRGRWKILKVKERHCKKAEGDRGTRGKKTLASVITQTPVGSKRLGKQ